VTEKEDTLSTAYKQDAESLAELVTKQQVAIDEAVFLLNLVLKNGSNVTPWVETHPRGAVTALSDFRTGSSKEGQ
jgi:hypothetical protein